MADFSGLPLRQRLYLAAYPWRRLDPVPWTRPPAALSGATVALVTSAGVLRAGVDEPFGRPRGGDATFRVIPAETPLDTLAIGQTSDAYDPEPAAMDRNLALPLDRLHALAAEGAIGRVAPRHLSFNGSIPSPGRLVADTAPAAAALLRADQVDVALLVPF